MRVISSIVIDYNPWLVLLAAIVCIVGSYVTMRLLERSLRTEGLQRLGWVFQAASAAGSSVWCMHFVAILAYDPGAPASFDPMLTVASLGTAISGFTLGFGIAAITPRRWAALAGGTAVGCAIALMHYVSMAAYHIRGLVEWDTTYVAASVASSVLLATAGFVLAIVAEHFIGMAAISVTPLAAKAANATVLEAMAISIAGVALFIVGTGVASQMIDSRSRTENTRRLQHMALNDPLTGLPNRASFSERLDDELARADRNGHKLAVVGIDLNRFKEINDFRGHSAGDQALRIIAKRLTQCIDDGEFVARIGGDEFAALKDFCDEDVLNDFLNRLEAALFEPIEIDDYRTSAGASIGVAV